MPGHLEVQDKEVIPIPGVDLGRGQAPYIHELGYPWSSRWRCLVSNCA